MTKAIEYPTKSPTSQKSKTKERLNFGEAMQAIIDGHNITKEEWKGWSAFLHSKKNTVTLKDDKGKEHSWIFSRADIIGEDYFII